MNFFKSRVSIYTSVTAITVCAIAVPAAAQDAKSVTAWEASRTVNEGDMVTTGVARDATV